MLLRGKDNWQKTRYIYQIALLALVFLILPFAAKPLQYSWSAITNNPYQIDREEGFLLNQALQLRHGDTIYPDLEDYPYTMGAYTPGYPIAYAGMLLFAEPGLPPGRLIVLLSVLGTACLLFVYIATETRQPIAAALAPMLFLTTYAVNSWIAYARVDFPAVLLSLAGLFMVGRGSAKFWIPASGILFVCAFYTKQTQLLAPASVLVALLIQRDWRTALRFSLFTAALALVIGIFLILITRGQFWMHTVVYNANEYHWNSVPPMMRHLWRFAHYTIIAMALAAILMPIILWRYRQPGNKMPSGSPLRLKSVYFYSLLAVVSILTIGKAGSAENYFIEFHLACALMISLVVGLLLVLMSRQERGRVGAAISLGLVAGALLLHASWMRSDVYQAIVFRPPYERGESANADFLLLQVIAEEGEILSEDAVLTILADKPALYQSFILSQLAREGKWDPVPFISDLEDRRFSMIITLRDMDEEFFFGFTEDMRDAVLDNYELDEVVPFGRGQQRLIYRPIK